MERDDAGIVPHHNSTWRFVMKAVHAIYALALGLATAGLLVTQTAAGHTPGYGVLSLGQVELIGLDTNICALGITQEMSKEGFLVTDRPRVSDAVLEVRVQTNGSLADHSQVEKAHFSAVLVGADDRVLFATGGNERSRNLQELCEDIGDRIAHQLKEKIYS
jgi:hypothetical protein